MASCKILISHDKNTQTCKQNQNKETEDVVYKINVEPSHSVDVQSLLAHSTADISALEKTEKVGKESNRKPEGESNLVKVAESLLQLGHDDKKKCKHEFFIKIIYLSLNYLIEQKTLIEII